MSYDKELLYAREIALRVGAFQRDEQASLGTINLKEDRSPVTRIDTTSETMIKDFLLSRFPHDGFLGEESGEQPSKSKRRWIVDPLDGTRPYIHKIPTYSVLIALEEKGELVVAVCYLPALDELYYASKGQGAFCNGKQLHVSHTAHLSDAMGSALGLTETGGTELSEKLFACMERWDYVYGFMDAYSYMCVAAGKLDLCISLIDKSWDRAPAALIVQEAGGVFSDLSGKPTIYGSTFVVSNKELHQKTVLLF